MEAEKPKSKRGGKRPGAGRKPKNPDAPKAAKPKRKSPSKAKRKGEQTPAEKAHDVLMAMAPDDGAPLQSSENQEPARRARLRTTGRRPGRVSPYQDVFAEQAQKLCKLGATDAELADFFKVDVRTIYRWAQRHEGFSQALKSGKEESDERVERSLYHRAIGYSHDAVKIFMPAGAEKPVYAPYTEHVPPDTTAGIFWLKNRRPDLWRDKRELVLSRKPEQMTDDDLAAIAASGRDGTVAPQGDPPILN